MIDWTPGSVALSIGPITIFWYGIMYAVGLAATFVVVDHEARRRGVDADIVVDAIIVVAVAALIGGRLYHVVDQWQYYKDNLLAIVTPPYSGLGVYGGIFTGFAAGILFARWKHQPVLTWLDIAAPGILTMQAIARWGNFFNQELYGPATNLPWGIAIDCAHRTPELACPPLGTTPVGAHFQPLFLYESISGAVGALVLLYLARHARRLRPGDLILLFFMWYGTTRFILEPLRTNNWTFFGVPTASILSAGFIIFALVTFLVRHRPGPAAPPGAGAGVGRAGDDVTLADGGTVAVGEPGSGDGPGPGVSTAADGPVTGPGGAPPG